MNDNANFMIVHHYQQSSCDLYMQILFHHKLPWLHKSTNSNVMQHVQYHIQDEMAPQYKIRTANSCLIFRNTAWMFFTWNPPKIGTTQPLFNVEIYTHLHLQITTDDDLHRHPSFSMLKASIEKIMHKIIWEVGTAYSFVNVMDKLLQLLFLAKFPIQKIVKDSLPCS